MLKIYKTIIMVCIAFCNMTSYAQNYNETSDEKEITLIVSGDGVNKEKATMTALRSAIEQAFGAFVSSNTKLLNDDLVKDEIVTISSGNIKKYEYLSELNVENKYLVTLKAVVSINNLIEFTKSKGGEVELSGGATAVMNQKIKTENNKNTRKAIDNVILQIIEALPSCFDYEVNLTHEPKAYSDELYGWPIEITVKTNHNIDFINKSFETILELIPKLGWAPEPIEREISCLRWYLREKTKKKMISTLRIEDDFGAYSFKERTYEWGDCYKINDFSKGKNAFKPSFDSYNEWIHQQDNYFRMHQWDYVQDQMKICVFAGNKKSRMLSFNFCYFQYSDPVDYYFCRYGMFSTLRNFSGKIYGKNYTIYKKNNDFVGFAPRLHIWYSHDCRFVTTIFGRNEGVRKNPSRVYKEAINGQLVHNEEQGYIISAPRLQLFNEDSRTPSGKVILELPITMLYSDIEMQTVKNIRVYASNN